MQVFEEHDEVSQSLGRPIIEEDADELEKELAELLDDSGPEGLNAGNANDEALKRLENITCVTDETFDIREKTFPGQVLKS